MANDIDKTSPHYKGEFGSIYEVNQKFPNGGVAGDYVEIDGWAHYWNADRGTWCVNAQRDSYWDELITGIIEKFKLIKGATYMGVANLDSVPAKAIGAKMYYFATVAGTYENFGELVVPQGINVLYSENGSSWVCSTLLEVAQELGVSTRNVVSQKVVNDALNLKANQSSVNEALEKKADKADMDVELGKKADKAAMDVELGKKADKAAMDVELGKKADKAAVDASLDLKANKSDVVKTNAAQDAEISRKANQQDVERSLNILRKEIGERTVVEGNVSNNPDEEDLTSKMGTNNREVLSLKDREYNPLEFSGKGYKILRKNIQEVTCAITKIQVTKAPTTDGYVSLIINGVETHVDLVASTDNTIALVAKKIADKLSETMDEYVTSIDGALVTCTRRFGGDVTTSSFSGVNTETEATISESSKTELRNLITTVMLNQSNCIYEIRYDFDLDGKTLEVPENCTLKFEGGSLSNGKLLFQDTFITSAPDYIFKSIQVDDKSRCLNIEVYAEWFGAHGDGNTDDTTPIQEALDFAYFSQVYKVKLLGRTYLITDTIWVKDHLCIEGSSYSNHYSSGANSNWDEINNKGNQSIILANLRNINKFAIDSDVIDENGNRYNIYHRFSSSKQVFGKYNGGSYILKHLRLVSQNFTYGGVRIIGGAVLGGLEDVKIDFVKVGAFIAKGWSLLINVVQIRSALVGLILGGELTESSFNTLQLTQYYISKDKVSESDYTYIKESIDNNFYGDPYSNNLSVGLIASATSGVFNALTVEGWSIGIIGTALQANFLSPYIEGISETILYCHSSSKCFLSNIVGTQTKETNNFTFVATSLASHICIEGTYHRYKYTFFDPYVGTNYYNDDYNVQQLYEIRNVHLYEFKYPGNVSKYVKWDIPNILYVGGDTVSDENTGLYFRQAISIEQAFKRINEDINYKNIDTIVLLSDTVIDFDKPIIIANKITINYKKLIINKTIYLDIDRLIFNCDVELNSNAFTNEGSDKDTFIYFQRNLVTNDNAVIINGLYSKNYPNSVCLSFNEVPESNIIIDNLFRFNIKQIQYHVLNNKGVDLFSKFKENKIARAGDILYQNQLPYWWNEYYYTDALGFKKHKFSDKKSEAEKVQNGQLLYDLETHKWHYLNNNEWTLILTEDYIKNNATNVLPDNPIKGMCVFNTTLNKPIWWTGTKWVDATGADV